MKKSLISALWLAPALLAFGNPPPATVAVHNHTRGVEDLGSILLEVLEVELAGQPDIELVDRSRLREILAEQELGEAGITGEQAAKFGKLVGAKYYIFGQSSRAADRSMIRCRVVQVDTGVYRPAMVLLADDQDPMTAGLELAKKVREEIAKLDERVLAAEKETAERPALKIPDGGKRPTIAFRIPEASVTPGAPTVDPACEKAMEAYLLENQFKLVQLSRPSQSTDISAAPREGFFIGAPRETALHLEGDKHEELFKEALAKKVDVIVLGIAASQSATQISRFHTARSRVELAAVRTSDRSILAVADGYGIATDLSLFVAEKKAIGDATEKLNHDFAQKIIDAFNEK